MPPPFSHPTVGMTNATFLRHYEADVHNLSRRFNLERSLRYATGHPLPPQCPTATLQWPPEHKRAPSSLGESPHCGRQIADAVSPGYGRPITAQISAPPERTSRPPSRSSSNAPGTRSMVLRRQVISREPLVSRSFLDDLQRRAVASDGTTSTQPASRFVATVSDVRDDGQRKRSINRWPTVAGADYAQSHFHSTEEQPEQPQQKFGAWEPDPRGHSGPGQPSEWRDSHKGVWAVRDDGFRNPRQYTPTATVQSPAQGYAPPPIPPYASPPTHYYTPPPSTAQFYTSSAQEYAIPSPQQYAPPSPQQYTAPSPHSYAHPTTQSFSHLPAQAYTRTSTQSYPQRSTHAWETVVPLKDEAPSLETPSPFIQIPRKPVYSTKSQSRHPTHERHTASPWDPSSTAAVSLPATAVSLPPHPDQHSSLWDSARLSEWRPPDPPHYVSEVLQSPKAQHVLPSRANPFDLPIRPIGRGTNVSVSSSQRSTADQRTRQTRLPTLQPQSSQPASPSGVSKLKDPSSRVSTVVTAARKSVTGPQRRVPPNEPSRPPALESETQSSHIRYSRNHKPESMRKRSPLVSESDKASMKAFEPNSSELSTKHNKLGDKLGSKASKTTRKSPAMERKTKHRRSRAMRNSSADEKAESLNSVNATNPVLEQIQNAVSELATICKTLTETQQQQQQQQQTPTTQRSIPESLREKRPGPSRKPSSEAVDESSDFCKSPSKLSPRTLTELTAKVSKDVTHQILDSILHRLKERSKSPESDEGSSSKEMALLADDACTSDDFLGRHRAFSLSDVGANSARRKFKEMARTRHEVELLRLSENRPESHTLSATCPPPVNGFYSRRPDVHTYGGPQMMLPPWVMSVNPYFDPLQAMGLLSPYAQMLAAQSSASMLPSPINPLASTPPVNPLAPMLAVQASPTQATSANVPPAQATQASLTRMPSTQVSLTQASSTQASPTQASSTQTSPTQASSTQTSPTQVAISPPSEASKSPDRKSLSQQVPTEGSAAEKAVTSSRPKLPMSRPSVSSPPQSHESMAGRISSSPIHPAPISSMLPPMGSSFSSSDVPKAIVPRRFASSDLYEGAHIESVRPGKGLLDDLPRHPPIKRVSSGVKSSPPPAAPREKKPETASPVKEVVLSSSKPAADGHQLLPHPSHNKSAPTVGATHLPPQEILYTLRIDTFHGDGMMKDSRQDSWAQTREVDVIRIYENPEVLVLPDLVTSAEIDFILKAAEGLWSCRPTPGVVVDEIMRTDDFGRIMTSSQQVPSDCPIWVAQITPDSSTCVGRVQRRLAASAQMEVTDIESVCLMRYPPGAFLPPHVDGHHKKTAVLFLNNLGTGGGAIAFLKLGLQIQPKRGTAVLWTNTKANDRGQSQLDVNSIHCDRPHQSKEKLILQCLFRDPN
eukprot:Gregarina_sp_Poly_1__7604@NODE_426_length_8588_cov_216_941204_g347_i0_p1_GENE_NODE_426_length_8588_cov_216_941204_g347_i0NODE_426_length_8588_cov_216_941204_g347_i0_p1_ORF_typecomplete_len1397_score241_042OGFeII_Oxy_3/PF13640_6/9_6e08DUF3461/PF11944_8/0_55SesA/PF17107_5/0_87SesA/PF17107_5/2_6e03_NODE_426_length_8588_cov_216_941204_g347_i01234313